MDGIYEEVRGSSSSFEDRGKKRRRRDGQTKDAGYSELLNSGQVKAVCVRSRTRGRRIYCL
jgi:hypothetical protein